MNSKFQSLWMATVLPEAYERLSNDINVDVAIIGGGLAGLSIAYALKDSGKKVGIFEATKIGSSTSGNTTAKITSMHDLKYAFLDEKVGADAAKIYAQSNEWAIKEIQRIVAKERIQCDFSIAPQYAYAETDDGLQQLQKEFDAAKKAGVAAELIFHDTDIPFPIRGELRFENQAYFHPRKYMVALGEVISDHGIDIFESTRIEEIEEGEVYVLRSGDRKVHAKKVVVATNFPIYDKGLFFLRMHQMRSYAIAAQLHAPLPKGMYLGVDGDGLTFRPYTLGEKQWLICGGQDRVTGDMRESEDPFAALEQTVKNHFSVKSFDYKWAAQDTMPIDKIPCIGKMPMAENMYVATGFGEWGMTTSIVAAKIISDAIMGNANEWQQLYSPARFKPQASFDGISSQVSHVVKGFGSYLHKTEHFNQQNLSVGEGKIVDHNGEKIAVHKDEENAIHAVSAKCTHMGCMVHWNGAEKSWDCPCHGSRFGIDGEILNSPAKKPLKKINLQK